MNGNKIQILENVTSLTEAVFTNLLPMTEYKILVVGCNKVFDHPQCPGYDQTAEMTVKTDIGIPGKMKPPIISFMNGSIAIVRWNADFEVGAETLWEVRIVGVDQGEFNDVMYHQVIITCFLS